MLCNAVLTNRYIGNDSFYILGGTLTSPLIFILGDIITEIWGYKSSRMVIFSGFLAQLFFVLVCQFVVKAPSPSFFTHYEHYSYILGSSLLSIEMSNFFAFVLGTIINSKILSRWKILMKGRFFALRSIGSSTISEALYSCIAIILMELHSIPFSGIMKTILISYLIKVLYNIAFCIPANFIVNFLKEFTGTDKYDFPENLTPLKHIHPGVEIW